MTTTTRIHRARLYPDATGVATATFRGQIADATHCWVIEGGRSGRPSIYAEVATDDTTATELTVQLTTTGAEVPAAHDGTPGHRLGTIASGKIHIYLTAVDGSADRAAYEAEVAQRKADKAARAAAAAAGFTPMPAHQQQQILGTTVVDLDAFPFAADGDDDDADGS